MKWKVETNLVRRWLIVNLIVLFTLNCMALAGRYFVGDTGYEFLGFFNLNAENNLPTFYSSSLIFASSILCSIVGIYRKKSGKKEVAYWLGLSVVLLCLSIDEFAQIHEKLTKILNVRFQFTGFFAYSWVIPLGFMAGVFGVLYVVRFLPTLPKHVRILMFLSGTIYLLGAVGFEMIGAKVASMHGGKVIYAILFSFEEMFEMGGMSLFFYSLTVYLHDELKMKIRFK